MKLHFFTAAASLATVFLVACAADPVGQTTEASAKQANAPVAANGDELVCTREYPTGTNIPVKKCRTRAQIDEEKAAAVDTLRRAQAVGPTIKTGGN